MGVGQPVAILLCGSSQSPRVLDLALSQWPGKFKAADGAGPKAESSVWDPLLMGIPPWEMSGDPLPMGILQLSEAGRTCQAEDSVVSKYFSFIIAEAARKAPLVLKTQSNVAMFAVVQPNKLPTHSQEPLLAVSCWDCAGAWFGARRCQGGCKRPFHSTHSLLQPWARPCALGFPTHSMWLF